MTGESLPLGIWYEEPRKRFRVRLYAGTDVFHLSYHESLDAAIAAKEDAYERRFHRPLFPRSLCDTGDQLASVRGEALQPSGDNPPMSQLLTVNRFLEIYFEDGSAPTKSCVWRWIRTGSLNARRVGRAYYIERDDAERFMSVYNETEEEAPEEEVPEEEAPEVDKAVNE